MKNIYKMLTGLSGALLLTLLSTTNLSAQCGGYRPSIKPSSWNWQEGTPHLLRTGLEGDYEHDREAGIVGFWHVKFVSDGVSSGIPGGIPKGVEVDAGYAQWHSDGTEIMNSGGRAPNTSNFCLGVWTKVGERKYKLNHFAVAWDPTKGAIGPAGPVGAILGPAHIQERVILAPGGDTFAGSFTIDQYDESGNHLVHIQGQITGTRIKVDTPATSVF